MCLLATMTALDHFIPLLLDQVWTVILMLDKFLMDLAFLFHICEDHTVLEVLFVLYLESGIDLNQCVLVHKYSTLVFSLD